METIKIDQLGASIPDCIDLNKDYQVEICGARCPDRDLIAQMLRSCGVSVTENGCHGTRGGCSASGVLKDGAYATVPKKTESGLQYNEVTVIL